MQKKTITVLKKPTAKKPVKAKRSNDAARNDLLGQNLSKPKAKPKASMSAPLQKRFDTITKNQTLSAVEKSNVRALLQNPKGFTNAEIKKMAGNKGKARGK